MSKLPIVSNPVSGPIALNILVFWFLSTPKWNCITNPRALYSPPRKVISEVLNFAMSSNVTSAPSDASAFLKMLSTS